MSNRNTGCPTETVPMSDIMSSKKKNTALTEVPMFACWAVSSFRERLEHKETSGVSSIFKNDNVKTTS